MIINLNIRANTIKVLEENLRVNLNDLGLGNSILDMTIKVQVKMLKKDKIDKLDFINIKNLCASIHMIKNMKRQTQNERKWFQSHI